MTYDKYKLEDRILYRLYQDNDGQLIWIDVMLCPAWIGTLDTAIDYYWS